MRNSNKYEQFYFCSAKLGYQCTIGIRAAKCPETASWCQNGSWELQSLSDFKHVSDKIRENLLDKHHEVFIYQIKSKLKKSF